MSKSTKGVDKPAVTTKKRPPAKTPEARENQLVALAMDEAERLIREGKATSQVLTHFLKLGSTRNKDEQDILKEQKKLVKAKTSQIESQKRVEELYAEALSAMKRYSGSGSEEVLDD